MRKRFTPDELDTINCGLDMVREEYEDENEMMINAIKHSDASMLSEIQEDYRRQSKEFGMFVSKIKTKLINLKIK
jgi:hypothetical protein